ncbi:alkaline phosphatase family protein [Clostridium sp. ZBS4]|uniref:alkaline phosphatase family protein n=1 Tax=Clostridium sp. ZBS4 TaxID=2949974 RepID=UPI0020793FE5|nr:alkaline phosphatase family protein [Clostridium sp. ZBS4]
MKYVMVIIDGLSDDPIKELNYKTPLETAFIPSIHYIATKGRVGRIATAYEGFPVESMVCIMGLLGFEPEKYYPCGRASFEAMAKGIPINDNDLVFRCNIVHTDEKKDCITDFTAGLISDREARKFIAKTNLLHNNWEIYPGQSYRNILIVREANVNTTKVKCFPPHMHIGENLNSIRPYGEDENTKVLLDKIWKFLLQSYDKESNKMLWVWSPSKAIKWPSFKEATGLNGAVVCGLDFLQGIAMAADIDFDIIPGATGYTDTDYDSKATYAKKYLENHDFVLVHINATDEEAHQHNYKGKTDAIEKVDSLIVGPLLQELHEKYKDDFRIIICGDHKTRCSDGKHIGDPVPFAIYGKDVVCSNEICFSEDICNKYEPIISVDFITKYLK